MSLLTNSISLRDTLTAKYVKLQETGGGANKITLQAPAAFTSYSLTLPTSVGNAGEVLSTDGAGGTSWITQSSGGGTASFADDTIEIYNATVASKLLHFSCTNIAANTTRNFVMTNSNIDLGTLPTQLLLTTSTPQFSKLGVGQAAGANQLDATGNMKVGTSGGLTVGAATPSAAQWAYLAALDQGLASSNSVTFTTATASTSAKWIETGGGADEITLAAPAAANYSLALPTGAGTVDYILATNGAGQLSWASQGSGSGTAAYSDSTFEIYNSATPTKKINFLVNSAAGTTRTITVPNTNVNLTNTPTQAVATTSTPQFAQLGVGQAAGAHQLDVTGAIKISAAGGLTIGAVTPSAAQWGYLAGLDQTVATSATAAFAKVGLGAGSVSAPSLYFNSHTSSGLYRIGSNNVGLSISGAKSLDFGASGVGISGLTYLTNGTLGAPALGFSAAATTGLYRIGADNVGISVGGTKKWDLATTVSTVAGAHIKARAVYGSIYKRGTTKYVDNCISNWNYCAGVNSSWQRIVWSSEKSLFVAVASSSPYIITSPNGRQWTTRTSPASLGWRSVCYGGNQFVATATNGTGNGVMTSSDGITWVSRAPVSNQSWQRVAYGAGYYCAVSFDGAVYRIMNSTDAVTWGSVATPVLNNWYGLCYGSASVGFVAVSNNGSSNRIMSSVNSTSWTSRTSPNGTYYAVTYSPELNLYCAVGDSGAITTSSDSVTWVTRTSPYAVLFYEICWSSELGIFLATSSARSVFVYSYDGITWLGGNINASAGTRQGIFEGVAWSPENNVFVAVGISSSYYGPFYSYDPRANLALVDSDYRLSSYRLSLPSTYDTFGPIIWTPWYRHWVGCQHGYYPSYSQYEGPIVWNYYNDINGNGIHSGVCTKFMNWLSQIEKNRYQTGDPTTWNVQTAPTSVGFLGIAYGLLTGVFSSGATNSGYIWYVSGTGTSWSSGSAGIGAYDNAYSPQLNKYVMVAGTSFAYSSNGTSYTTGTLNPGISLRSIAWSPELAIFCAVTGSSNGIIYASISSDGQSWETNVATNSVVQSFYTRIKWIPDAHIFLVYATYYEHQTDLYPAYVIKSYDGRNWTPCMSIIKGTYTSYGYSPEYGQVAFPLSNASSSSRYLMGYTVAKYAY